MTTNTRTVVVTVDNSHNPYQSGKHAIESLSDGQAVSQPATIRFQTEAQLTEVFNERTYRLLRIIRDEQPASIRETARLVERDKKNVHQELTMLEALGVIRFETDGRAKRPVFPYDELIVRPLSDDSTDSTVAIP